MSENPQIAVLETNRFMRSPQEVVAFEQALAELANTSPADLPKLHLILDDDCQQPEVMFSLIHFLESFALQDQLQALIQVLPRLVKQAAG
jgi:Immunity protein 30